MKLGMWGEWLLTAIALSYESFLYQHLAGLSCFVALTSVVLL